MQLVHFTLILHIQPVLAALATADIATTQSWEQNTFALSTPKRDIASQAIFRLGSGAGYPPSTEQHEPNTPPPALRPLLAEANVAITEYYSALAAAAPNAYFLSVTRPRTGGLAEDFRADAAPRRNDFPARRLHDDEDTQPQSTLTSITSIPLKITHVIGNYTGITNCVTHTCDYKRTITLLTFMCSCGVLFVLGFMNNGAQAPNQREAPRWNPDDPSAPSFRSWLTDISHWCLRTQMPPHEQALSIADNLGGTAREMTRTITPQEFLVGGQVNGVQLDPVSYIIAGLHSQFAQLDEETRIQAMCEFLAFNRRSSESINSMLARHEIVRNRARVDGRFDMGVEGVALQIVRILHFTPHQLVELLRTFGGSFPSNEGELRLMTNEIRRNARITENVPNNIGSFLQPFRQAQRGSYLVTTTEEPQLAIQDENASTFLGMSYAPQDQVDSPYVSGGQSTEDNRDYWSSTDSDTSSDNYEDNIDMSDVQNLPTAEAEEILYYQKSFAKKRWRRYTAKPVRKVRRFIRKRKAYFMKGGKGKGRRPGKGHSGKGKRQHTYYNDGTTDEDWLDGISVLIGKPEDQVASTFLSSGKGKGRSGNPIGRDGEKMKCFGCGSTDHLNKDCPTPGGQGKGNSHLYNRGKNGKGKSNSNGSALMLYQQPSIASPYVADAYSQALATSSPSPTQVSASAVLPAAALPMTVSGGYVTWTSSAEMQNNDDQEDEGPFAEMLRNPPSVEPVETTAPSFMIRTPSVHSSGSDPLQRGDPWVNARLPGSVSMPEPTQVWAGYQRGVASVRNTDLLLGNTRPNPDPATLFAPPQGPPRPASGETHESTESGPWNIIYNNPANNVLPTSAPTMFRINTPRQETSDVEMQERPVVGGESAGAALPSPQATPQQFVPIVPEQQAQPHPHHSFIANLAASLDQGLPPTLGMFDPQTANIGRAITPNVRGAAEIAAREANERRWRAEMTAEIQQPVRPPAVPAKGKGKSQSKQQAAQLQNNINTVRSIESIADVLYQRPRPEGQAAPLRRQGTGFPVILNNPYQRVYPGSLQETEQPRSIFASLTAMPLNRPVTVHSRAMTDIDMINSVNTARQGVQEQDMFNATRFLRESQVRWNGTPLPTHLAHRPWSDIDIDADGQATGAVETPNGANTGIRNADGTLWNGDFADNGGPPIPDHQIRAPPRDPREIPIPPDYRGEVLQCGICLMPCVHNDNMSRLGCRHAFHTTCYDGWTQARGNDVMCPMCRGSGDVIARWAYIGHENAITTQLPPNSSTQVPQTDNGEDFDLFGGGESAGAALSSPQTSPQVDLNLPQTSSLAQSFSPSHPPPGSARSVHSDTSSIHQAFPTLFDSQQDAEDAYAHSRKGIFYNPENPIWEPPHVANTTYLTSGNEEKSFHSETRPTDGSQGVIVDPGSLANLGGSAWSQDVGMLSMKNGRTPKQVKRDRTLRVSGVGVGSQAANFNVELPIAIQDTTGKVSSGLFDTPSVKDSDLPGLLGLISLKNQRGILDMINNKLYFCGPSDIDLLPLLPPGTKCYQLEEAPSGHLLLPCTKYKEFDTQQSQGRFQLDQEQMMLHTNVAAPPGLDASGSVRTSTPDSMVSLVNSSDSSNSR